MTFKWQKKKCFIIFLMGCCAPQLFKASFSANLRQLFDYYLKMVLYIKDEQLFLTQNARLQAIVDLYLTNPRSFDRSNLELCAIDSAHKLHPADYGTQKVTKEWLINACLRQHKFIEEFPIQILNFEASYKHYVEFLFSCSQNSGKVIVPNKLADFMWHSHMQDNFRYKIDSTKMLQRVLDHLDDIPEPQMKQYARQTQEYRQKVFSQAARKSESKPSTAEREDHSILYQFIDYGPYLDTDNYSPNIGPNNCNDSSHPDRHHQKDENCGNKAQQHHHHHHNHKDNTHSHDPPCHPQNQAIHPASIQNHHGHHHSPEPAAIDTNHHQSSCGGHHSAAEVHHSSCGGGHSSCGGGHSSCGGGASSCGGGASSCGGSSCGSG